MNQAFPLRFFHTANDQKQNGGKTWELFTITVHWGGWFQRSPFVQILSTSLPVAAAVTEVVDPENTTLPPPFARVDPNDGSLLYMPGESVDTVFPSKCGVQYGAGRRYTGQAWI